MNDHLTQLQTNPPVTEREWTVDGIPVLFASVCLPCPLPQHGRAARRIRGYYRLQSRCYLRYCEMFLLPLAAAEYRAALAASRPLPSVHAQLTHRVTLHKNGLWSLYTQSEERGLPGPPLIRRRGDTWDLKSGYPVPLQSLFPGSRSWKKFLTDAAAREIPRREAAGVCTFFPKWPMLLRRRFDGRNYYLTEEGLTFFYPMCTIAPAAAGIPAFTVGFGALEQETGKEKIPGAFAPGTV